MGDASYDSYAVECLYDMERKVLSCFASAGPFGKHLFAPSAAAQNL